MTMIILLALIATVAKLWFRVSELERRIGRAPRYEPVSASNRREDFEVGDEVVEPMVTDAAVHTEAVFQTAPDSPSEVRAPESEPNPGAEESPVETSPRPKRRIGFEDLFGRLLPIWAGGVTLAVAGFLIVKFSIDRGLLSPLVRFISGLLFGTALIAAAEVALRAEARVRDARVRQALSGAGIATLYAAVLVAANLYHLIGPGVAFVGMALITALAGGLSLRFGAPSALLGLVGGLAAPALVGSEAPDVPLLVGYLALAVGGLCTLSRTQRWMWLGVGALGGGFGWGAVLLASGSLDASASLALGLFMLLLGVILPVVALGGTRGPVLRMAASLAACAEVAALVASGGFLPLDWALFGLISIALVWLAHREPALRTIPPIGLAVAMILIAIWPRASVTMLTVVLSAFGAIYGVPAAWRVWREGGKVADAAQIASIAVAAYLLPKLHYGLPDHQGALLALLGAAIAGTVGAAGWANASRRNDPRFAVLASTAAALLATAGASVVPEWLVAPWLATIAATTLLLAGQAEDPRVEKSSWALAIVALFALALAPPSELLRALDVATGGGGLRSAVRWIIPALAAAVFAFRSRTPLAPWFAQPVAVALSVVALAQVVPAPFGPVAPSLLLVLLALDRRTTPAAATAAIIALGWSLIPLAQWVTIVGGALVGFPAFVTSLPGLEATVLRLIIPGLAIAVAAAQQGESRIRMGIGATAAVLAGAALHILYKQLFAISDAASFVRLGLVERTLWEAALAALALMAWRRSASAAMALGLAALAHLLWFSILLHNPLWAAQNVGSWPLLNLLLPAYALGFGLLWVVGRLELPPTVERVRLIIQMLLVVLLAASELRQLVHGSNLVSGGVGQGEDIARSVLLIALAIGFLRFGIARSSRDWRIASLVLMLAAVGKVFLLDAAGLDGLLRIAAFAALGFSLIGIGWLYQRTLPESALTKDQRLADRSSAGE